jgi:hypothetical protein
MHAMKDKEPPLADISPGGRALRAAKSRIEHFCVGLINGLDAEINKNQNEQTRLNLDHARKWLQGSMKQLIQLAEANADRRNGAKILKLSLDAMYACADAVSRIDHKRIPRIAEKRTKSTGGKVAGISSGIIRAKKAKQKWQNKAMKLARKILERHPTHYSMAAVARDVKDQWDGELPVSSRWLYKFLCEQKNAGAFQKVDR